MTAGKAKVELLLEMKNRLKSGMSTAKKHFSKDVSEMKSKINELKSSSLSSFNDIKKGMLNHLSPVKAGFTTLKNHGSKALHELKDEVPIIGKAFRLMKNPIALAATAIIGLGMAVNVATKDAAAFNTNFRQLQMLNLEKPIQDMKTLKKLVRDTAYDKGFDITKTSTAFFDVQSVTGKYGSEVKNIVSKQGEFAHLMQADFNSWVEGTAKAMANYGFGADKLDEFNRAAFATVKTGVTTFDQLSKVMSVYAGSASSAKQNFGAANKIFSLFTVKVKSVDEAATLTKSLFNDLTKKSTISAFKKIGINVYDNNKKMKQADSLLLELSDKFENLGNNDVALIKLKNQFSGSEGLTSFIQSAMGSTEQLQTMINNFDTTGLDLSKALNISKQDSTYLKEILENQLQTLKIDFGDAMLPIKNRWLQSSINAVEGWNAGKSPIQAGEKYRLEGTDYILDLFSGIINNPGKHSTKQYDKAFSDIKYYRENYQTKYDETRKYEGNIHQTLNTNKRYLAYFSKGALSTLRDLEKQLIQARISLPKNHDELLAQSENNNLTTPTEDGSSDSISKITGSARQIKNLTINIDAFNKGGINTQNTNLKDMSPEDIEAWMNDMFIRVINNVERNFS